MASSKLVLLAFFLLVFTPCVVPTDCVTTNDSGLTLNGACTDAEVLFPTKPESYSIKFNVDSVPANTNETIAMDIEGCKFNFAVMKGESDTYFHIPDEIYKFPSTIVIEKNGVTIEGDKVKAVETGVTPSGSATNSFCKSVKFDRPDKNASTTSLKIKLSNPMPFLSTTISGAKLGQVTSHVDTGSGFEWWKILIICVFVVSLLLVSVSIGGIWYSCRKKKRQVLIEAPTAITIPQNSKVKVPNSVRSQRKSKSHRKKRHSSLDDVSAKSSISVSSRDVSSKRS